LDEARRAKQRRRIERRYRQTGLQSDKEAYLSACSTARESILKSRAADIKSELDKAAGDVGATWRTAETVAQPTQGRVRRRPVRTTSLNILPVLRRQGEMHPRQHLGGTAVISPSHVRCPSAPRTTAVFIRASDHRGSPKAVVRHAVQVVTTRCPAVLFTEVMHSHVHTSHCQTCQPVTADWKVSCPIQESAGASTVEEGRAQQFTASELQADLQPANRVQGPRETRSGTPAAHLLSSANFSQFQLAYRKGHSTETALLQVLGGLFTAADDKQVTVLIGLDLSAAFDTVSSIACCSSSE